MSEKERVKRVLSGDTSAFAYFVDCYQDMAFTIAYRVCGNEQDAEDVVQESYVKAYRNLHGFRSESKFSTWLYRIVYNTAITHSKRRLWEVNREAEPDDALQVTEETLQEEIEVIDRKAVVNDILGRMPTGEALLLTLYYMEDHPCEGDREDYRAQRVQREGEAFSGKEVVQGVDAALLPDQRNTMKREESLPYLATLRWI